MKLFFFLLRRSPGAFALAMFIGVLSGLASTGLLAIVHRALGNSLEWPRATVIWAFVGLCVLAPSARVLSQYLLVRLSQRMLAELRLQLASRIIAAPLRQLEHLGAHRVLATLTDDVSAIANSLAQIPTLCVLIAIVSTCLIYLASLSLALFAVLLVIMLLGIISYQIPLMMGERRFVLAREERDSLFDHLRSLIEGIQELKLHRLRARAFMRLLDRSSQSLRRLVVSSLTIYTTAASWGHLLFFVVVGVLIFAVPGWQVVSASALLGYALVLLYMMNPLQGILDLIPDVVTGNVALSKVERLGLSLAEMAVGDDLDRPMPSAGNWQRLDLVDVTFRYRDEDRQHHFVVGPLNITFEAGELVFLVGGNGSGKTTFAKLLTGLYEPSSGEIRIDGKPLTEEDVADYGQLFSMVFSVPHLFESFLGVDRPDLDDRVREYLEKLELSGKVEVASGKLSTLSLSQGQRKRLALLNAYLEDRSIYVFDEWAADQDPVFRETFYCEILPDLKAKGKTILVISHDDRYYSMANRIVKLDFGQIQYDGDYASFSYGATSDTRDETRDLVTLERRTSPKSVVGASDNLGGTTMTESSRERGEANLEASYRRRKRRLKRFLLSAAAVLCLLLILGAGAGLWLRGRLLASLPQLEGEALAQGLAESTVVERDALGIPTVRATSRRDVAVATGFLHAQDRFFQMDLARRGSAGELSELFGKATLDLDVAMRRHRFRVRARKALENSAASLQDLLEAYSEGVNSGLEALADVPPEYVLLRTDPVPWQAEDTFLVLLSMFAQLKEPAGTTEAAWSLMRERLPPELFDFLVPWGTEWDAPLIGEAIKTPPVPGPEVVDLRDAEPAILAQLIKERQIPRAPVARPVEGSNGWAINGSRSAGGALLANDLHLSLAVPNIWYRMAMTWPAMREDVPTSHRLTGMTLPGAPMMVLGSNGHIAWGLTNSTIDASDILLVDIDPEDPASYLTSDGARPFERHQEVVRVKGGGEHMVEVVSTHWGPVIGEDENGRQRAFRWSAHDTETVNLEIIGLETARDVGQALEIAHHSGVPLLSFLVADSGGHIGWTLIGKIPRRVGFGGRWQTSWSDGSRGWQGYLAPEEVPRIIDPENGLLWAANNRLVGGETLARLGDGGYVLGARARQIRDQLQAMEGAKPEDMLAIQLDDRALLHARWRDLMLEVLSSEAVADQPRRQELRRLIENWSGRASVDSAGYRLIRAYRIFLAQNAFRALTAHCREIEPDFEYIDLFRQYEGPLWQLVSERPVHLLDPQYASWEEFLLSMVDTTLSYYGTGPLAERTWGERNTSMIQHPISQALPIAGAWLDMRSLPLPGDADMPRVQGPSYGASIRMVVTPGREEEGILHMPGGQSGHLFSPHYRDSHAAWAHGEATPFLPGETVHTLHLSPGG